MMEVRDNNSNAILFKRTPREKKVDELEDKVKKLENLVNVLLLKGSEEHYETTSSTNLTIGDVSNT